MRKLFLIILIVWLQPLSGQEPATAGTAGAETPVAQTASNDPARKAPPAEDVGRSPQELEEAQADEAVRTLEHELTDGLRNASSQAVNRVFDQVGIGREARALLRQKIGIFSIGELAGSFLLLLLAVIIRTILKQVVFRHLHKVAARSKTTFDEGLLHAIERPISWLVLLTGFSLAILVLPVANDVMRSILEGIFKAATVTIVIWAAVRVIDAVSEYLMDVARQRQSAMHGFLPVLRKTGKFFVITVGVLMVIDNLGYNVSGILATLGIGGAALAFASKDTIANGFGTLMIILDRPFKVGDWIVVNDQVDGDVESIGLRSTKVRTFPKTVMSIPNGVLANEYINNWSRMPKRRVKQYVGITYEATADDIEGLVEDFKQLLREDEGVHQEFILVSFTDFGDSSLNIMVYYFTVTTAWMAHMEIRQRINCKIMRAIKARGLSIAFPTRSLYLDGPVASKLAGEEYASRWDAQTSESDGRLPGDFGPQSPP